MKYDFTLNSDGTVKSAFWEVSDNGVYYTTQRKTGEGVFIHTAQGEKQIAGTSQFCIYGLTQGTARAKIRKFMQDNGYSD